MTQDGATNGVSTNLELEQHQANQVCKCQIFRQEEGGLKRQNYELFTNML